MLHSLELRNYDKMQTNLLESVLLKELLLTEGGGKTFLYCSNLSEK